MTNLPGSVRVIDTHAHVWPRGLRHPGQRHAGALAATPADLLAIMLDAGVDAAIVSPAMLVYPDNGFVLGATATVPDKIFAVVGVDPRDPASVESVARHAANGAVGVRVNTGATPLAGAEHLAGLDAVVDAATAANLVMQWTIPLASSNLIERAGARSPGLRQVLDHLGLPGNARDLKLAAQIRALAALPFLHVKLSGMYALSHEAYPYRDVWPWAEAVIDAFGPQRTMWASDWPLADESSPYLSHLRLVTELPFLDAGAKRAILGDTATRFWWGDQRSRPGGA